MRRTTALLAFLLLSVPAWAQQNTGTTRRIRVSSSLPTTCSIGEVIFKSAATVGTYECYAANTWRIMASAAGSSVTISGTTNQVTSTGSHPTFTLSLPQNIHTGASPVFAGMTLTGMTGLLQGASGVVSALSAGAANRIVGMNAAGGANEYKAIATGTSGTDFAVAHTANTITFNLPTASAANRGALSTTDWTTFNNKVATTRAITATSPLTGTGTLAGDITLGLAGLSALGTANQIIGMNSSATAYEYKSLAAGSSGTDFAIAHTANTVTLNIPSASAANRGLVTTAAQTLAGTKLFSSGTIQVGTNDGAGNYEYGTLVASGSGAITLSAATGGTGTDNINIVLTPTGTGYIKFDKFGPLTSGIPISYVSLSPVPVDLTPGEGTPDTVDTNAALGNVFRVSVDEATTFNAPTNPTDGQSILYEIKNDGGSGEVTFATGSSGAFAWSVDVTGITLTAVDGKVDKISWRYNSTAQRWQIEGINQGH